jgi:geranylgeranyl diphosphate synthase type II
MLQEWYDTYKRSVDSALSDYLDKRYTKLHNKEEEHFEEAIRYAVMSPAKRIRPLLGMIAYEELMGLPGDVILPYLIGLELIHVSTLVHDDLPGIDADDMRWGQPSLWKRYGEGTAIIVWDALQIMGIECLAESRHIQVITEITSALWDKGMMRGQARDILTPQSGLDKKEMIRLHDEKTGRFISSSLMTGAILAGVVDGQIYDQLRWFGVLLGRAFQIREDILDYDGRLEETGRSLPKDTRKIKSMVTYMGIEKTRKLLQDMEYALIDITNNFQTTKFADMVEFVVKRER